MTKFIGEVKDSTKEVRLSPVLFPDGSGAVVAVVNAGVIQFIRNGEFIQKNGSRIEVSLH